MSAAPIAQDAAPAWRQFTFFTSTPFTASHDDSIAPEIFRQPPLISTICSSPSTDLVLLADLEGDIHVLNSSYDIMRSWRAYGSLKGGGRCTHLVCGEGRWKGVVVTCGEDPESTFPVIKVWDLGRAPSSAAEPPILLRFSIIKHTSRPYPVSAIAISTSLSHVVIGTADGSVFAFRHLDQLLEGTTPASNSSKSPVLGLGKLRVLHEGKEPITGLGFRTTISPPSRSRTTPSPVTNLFIFTTGHVLTYPISSSKTDLKVAIIDDIGAGVGCCGVMDSIDGARLIMAREEAIYVYGAEGREGCFAFEGSKSGIRTLTTFVSSSSPAKNVQSSYIAIISPPILPTLISNSATIRNYARNLIGSSGMTPSVSNTSSLPKNDIAKVTIFDIENKLIAFTGTFEEGVRDVWEAFGAVWVLTEGGILYRLFEKPLATSLSSLFERNSYTLAVSLAQSRGLAPSEIAEIYRRYGDHLYSKADYEGAVGCYLKTVGTVQASYVIRKFLDAQRLSHLTSYLQELHARGLANSDHTTLLLNCYTKLADDTALSSFLRSSSDKHDTVNDAEDSSKLNDEPPFDLETAIKVCRQAGYFDQAVWLTKRYKQHQEYLRIQIEDVKDFGAALKYLRNLGYTVAEENLVRYGKALLEAQPRETTELLIDLCCGNLERVEVEGEEELKSNEKGYLAYLSSYTIPNGSNGSVSPTSSTPASDRIPPTATNGTTTRSGPNRKSGIDQSNTEEDLADVTVTPVELPSPRQFFAHFVDHSEEFITFLETLAARRWGKSLESIQIPSQSNLLPPRPLRMLELEEGNEKDEQSIWNTLLELYLSSDAKNGPALEGKALKLLQSREEIHFDETQALLICTLNGFVPGFILLYEQLGMYEDIINHWIELGYQAVDQNFINSRKVIEALDRYGPSHSNLYRIVLQYLTSNSELLSNFQLEIIRILEVVDERKILPSIAVVQILSSNGTASIGLVREYLRKQLSAEKIEIDSDRGLISSYRIESTKKEKEIQELSDPNTPRIFQVTRCSACGGGLDIPSVHFMCRHSYHQRCLAESEIQCPNCAREHGVIREIRKNNESFLGSHDVFLDDVKESEDGFKYIADTYSKALI